MNRTLIERLEEHLDNATDALTEIRPEMLRLCEKSFCDALQRHSDLNSSQIKQAWLQYQATELDFEVG